MGIALGSTPGVGQPYAVRQQPTSPVFHVLKGRVVAAAGSDREVFMQSGTYMTYMPAPTGRIYAGQAEGEGCTS